MWCWQQFEEQVLPEMPGDVEKSLLLTGPSPQITAATTRSGPVICGEPAAILILHCYSLAPDIHT
jgi:hypothetical protein